MRQGVNLFQTVVDFIKELDVVSVGVGRKTAQPVKETEPVRRYKAKCFVAIVKDVTAGVVVGGIGIGQARCDLDHFVALAVGQFGGDVFLKKVNDWNERGKITFFVRDGVEANEMTGGQENVAGRFTDELKCGDRGNGFIGFLFEDAGLEGFLACTDLGVEFGLEIFPEFGPKPGGDGGIDDVLQY